MTLIVSVLQTNSTNSMLPPTTETFDAASDNIAARTRNQCWWRESIAETAVVEAEAAAELARYATVEDAIYGRALLINEERSRELNYFHYLLYLISNNHE